MISSGFGLAGAEISSVGGYCETVTVWAHAIHDLILFAAAKLAHFLLAAAELLVSCGMFEGCAQAIHDLTLCPAAEEKL